MTNTSFNTVNVNFQSSNRRRLDDSDDNISDASSLCSERGQHLTGMDYGGGAKMAEDLMAVTSGMASANWMDRKDGLLMLSSCLQRGRILKFVSLSNTLFLSLFLQYSLNTF